LTSSIQNKEILQFQNGYDPNEFNAPHPSLRADEAIERRLYDRYAAPTIVSCEHPSPRLWD
jgi:hypothetical protein